MSSAIKEFGRYSFAEASLNNICKEGNISKGIIYHYFKDKDEWLFHKNNTGKIEDQYR